MTKAEAMLSHPSPERRGAPLRVPTHTASRLPGYRGPSHAALAVVTDTRPCRRCGATKPETEFYTGRHGKPYLDCKRCHGKAVMDARKRKALLRLAVIEAARALMAAELRLEHAQSSSKDPDAWDDLAATKGEAWQTLRDALAAERASR